MWYVVVDLPNFKNWDKPPSQKTIDRHKGEQVTGAEFKTLEEAQKCSEKMNKDNRFWTYKVIGDREEFQKTITASGVAINDHVCPVCGNNRCSKTEKICWRCGNSLH